MPEVTQSGGDGVRMEAPVAPRESLHVTAALDQQTGSGALAILVPQHRGLANTCKLALRMNETVWALRELMA